MDKSFQTEEPFFIVGAPRSGTTMLSVMLDRHSNISIPPETQFFNDLQPGLQAVLAHKEIGDLVSFVLKSERIKDLEISHEEVMEGFTSAGDRERDLFLALLKAYSKKTGCKKIGEKSPLHLLHLPKICKHFPQAKIVCIVRDGRDVVRSLMNVPWAEPDNPRRFYLFCQHWNEAVEKIIQAQRSNFRDRFYLLTFEQLLRDPEQQLQDVCRFIGVEFETQQFLAQTASATVPAWEQNWKGKAVEKLDSARIQVWKKEATPEEKYAMNILMGDALQKMGYDHTEIIGCSLQTKIKYLCIRLTFNKALLPVVLFGLKCKRYINRILPVRSNNSTIDQ